MLHRRQNNNSLHAHHTTRIPYLETHQNVYRMRLLMQLDVLKHPGPQ